VVKQRHSLEASHVTLHPGEQGGSVLLSQLQPSAERVTFAIELQAGAEPPTEFRLFGAGPNKAHDGRGTFVFDDLSAQACMTHSAERGLDYVIDYEHASLSSFSLDPAESGKAAGWFTPEIRDGALFATNVKWTPKATEKLKAREFRYFSPAADFEATPDGGKRITKLINCALTNNPALAGIPPLMATAEINPKEHRMNKILLSLLKLSETASEAELQAAITRLVDGHAALLSATGKTNHAEALGVLAGWKAGAEQAVTLSAELGELKKTAAAKELDEVITAAKTGGQLPPAAEATARQIGLSSGVVALKAFLEVLPKHGGERAQPDPSADPSGGQSTVTLSTAEKAAAKGDKALEAAMLKRKQERAAKSAA
jgi:phage I-like protein